MDEFDHIEEGADEPRGLIDRDAMLRMKLRFNRPLKTLMVLVNDPFCIGGRQNALAQWFKRIYELHRIQPGFHLRRIHYRLASQEEPVLCCDGSTYKNNVTCWNDLLVGSLFARYMKLIPADALVDRRNPDSVIRLNPTQPEPRAETVQACMGVFSEPEIYSEFGDEQDLPSLSLRQSGALPGLELVGGSLSETTLPKLGEVLAAAAVQPYHLEIWCEKTS